MNFESYKKIFYSEKGATIRPFGKSFNTEFSFNKSKDKRYRLYVEGEAQEFYQWKGEYDEPYRYASISDSLDVKNAEECRFCLNLTSKKVEDFKRTAYKKIMWRPVLSYLPMVNLTENFTFGIKAKTNNLFVEKNGYITVKIAGFRHKDGVDIRSVENDFDFVYTLDLAENTNNTWKNYQSKISIPLDTTHVGYWVEAFGYSGEVYLEKPFLTSENGWNLVPDFDLPVSNEEKFDWTGINLSKHEWPEFKVILNGKNIFEGARFERSHRFSEWEIEIPQDAIDKENTLEIALISSCHNAPPYIFREIGIIEQAGGDFSLIAVPQVGYVKNGICVLLRTQAENTTVKFASDGKIIAKSEYFFKEKGLHGVRLEAEKPCQNAEFSFTSNGISHTGCVDFILPEKDEEVITGTGDMIYINAENEDMEEYLSWYISNRVGDFLTIRPTYRWSGTRVLHENVWKTVVRVLNEMQIYYCLMVDGRELPGLNAQPHIELLQGDYFLGRQNHERDGASFYWGNMSISSPTAEQKRDLTEYLFKEYPENTRFDYSSKNDYYVDGQRYINRNPKREKDCKKAYFDAVKSIENVKGNCTRHTGPAVLFAPFAECGYKWLGAETMYSTIELQMAFLRGATEANEIIKNGVHHAVQWSSSPHDAPEHFKRYRLALYSSYIQGANHINTEEGLWHMEEYYVSYHRFDNCCVNHLKQQQDFFKYISTHSRKGKFYANSAIIQGRYDGWIGFTNCHPWGWCDESDSEAENSWQILREIYPKSQPGKAVYCHNCTTEYEPGYFTGTPYGNLNVLPAQGKKDTMEEYKFAAFTGYHCAEEKDFIKLEKYVENGGTLMLTRGHLCNTTDFEDVKKLNIKEIENHPFKMCEGEPKYAIEHFNGAEIKICKNIKKADNVLKCTDEGTPLIAEYFIKKGKVILFNVLCYPANEAIKENYGELLKENIEKINSLEKIWCKTDDKVEFAVYDNGKESRTIYLQAVDWYNDENALRNAQVNINGTKYQLSLKFGVLYKLVASGNLGVLANDENGEIEKVGENEILVRTCGKASFSILKNGEILTKEYDFTDGQVHNIM